MKNQIVHVILIATLAACGGKAKNPPTTPDPSKAGGTMDTTEMKSGSTGGATYGAPVSEDANQTPPAAPSGGGGPM
jgi:hypothetical protein